MPKLNQGNLMVRDIFTSVFVKDYPRSFRQLQDMTLAAANAQRNVGKRSIFGKDKGADAIRKFKQTAETLCLTLVREGATNTVPNAENEMEKVNSIVQAFFCAYPNWKDAEQVWAGFYLALSDPSRH